MAASFDEMSVSNLIHLCSIIFEKYVNFGLMKADGKLYLICMNTKDLEHCHDSSYSDLQLSIKLYLCF